MVSVLRACIASFKRERVVRTLAVPPGPWQFPAKIGSAINQPSSDQPGYLGPEKTRESVNAEFDRFHREMEERNEHFFGMDSKDSKEPLKPTSPARGAGSGAEGGSNGKERNRAITKLRIAVHGPTKHCQACKDFTYSHTKACQARFNSLLDRLEPKIIPKLFLRGNARVTRARILAMPLHLPKKMRTLTF